MRRHWLLRPKKYDELAATLQLLHQQVTHTEIPAKKPPRQPTASSELKSPKHELSETSRRPAAQLGDDVDAAIVARREADSAARAATPRCVATTQQEALVAEAEQIGSQPERTRSMEASGARMRELLDALEERPTHPARLDKGR
ncbi:MAG: hypothetical protein IPH27_06225 [Actinomycetales bacterium]|nr:hypothetical protein [Candidatus Phosphoribacter baldrii]